MDVQAFFCRDNLESPFNACLVPYSFGVVYQKSFYFVCHSGPDPESSVSKLDSRLRGNDGLRNAVRKCRAGYPRFRAGTVTILSK